MHGLFKFNEGKLFNKAKVIPRLFLVCCCGMCGHRLSSEVRGRVSVTASEGLNIGIALTLTHG